MLSNKEGTNKVKSSGNRKCIHNVKQQNIDVNSDKKDSARQGPGRKKGQDRVPGKHTPCPSKLSFQLAGAWPTINIRPHIMHFRRLAFSYTEVIY